MEIRRFRVSDCSAIAVLFDAIAAVEPTFQSCSSENFLRFARLSFNADARDFLVVEECGHLVALATSTLLPRANRPKRHFRIFVQPAARRRGIGTRLLDAVQNQPLPPDAIYQANCSLSWRPRTSMTIGTPTIPLTGSTHR